MRFPNPTNDPQGAKSPIQFRHMKGVDTSLYFFFSGTPHQPLNQIAGAVKMVTLNYLNDSKGIDIFVNHDI
jgi:hypothetical protein